MAPKRPLSEKELEDIIERMTDGQEIDDDFDVCDDSDLSDEDIENDDYYSLSEESASDEEQDEACIDNNFYVGKDKITKWSKTSFKQISNHKRINIVKVPAGLRQCSKDISNELEAFLKIIDLNMIDEIVKFTNMYIDQLTTRYEYSRERDCKHTTRSEFMAYLGLLYLLGIKKLHHTNVKEVWTLDGTGMTISRAVMSYKRFLFLTRSLRFDDKTTRAERRAIDKLAAIRPFLDPFVENSKACFNLSEYVTIDKMLHPFRGRCSFIQHIPSKPAKCGIKMYAMCDAQYFYTSNIEVYCGKQPDGPYALSNAPMEIVKRLVAPIENSGRNLTTDNYYTSIPLADYLLDKKITLLGTLKKNKNEIPLDFLPNKTKAAQSITFGFQKDKMITSYVPRKSKAVILLSTLDNKDEIDNATRKPEVIMDYNATKGGVDAVDKMCASYTVSRITKRWPCVIFYSLMNIAGINTQILYSFAKPSATKDRRRIFLKNLSLALMKEHLTSRTTITCLPSDISAFLRTTYATPLVTIIEDHQPPKRGHCRACVLEKKKSTASMKCDSCNCFTCKKHSHTNLLCNECKDNSTSSF